MLNAVPESGTDPVSDSRATVSLSGYDSPQDALKALGTDYNYWSGKLTDSSLQLCYALIGANWIVFHSVQGIRNSALAEWSLGVVMATLAINVVTSWWASEHLRNRYGYAEENPARWQSEFEKARGKKTPWPATRRGELVGIGTRVAKGLLPLIAGGLLICGAWSK